MDDSKPYVEEDEVEAKKKFDGLLERMTPQLENVPELNRGFAQQIRLFGPKSAEVYDIDKFFCLYVLRAEAGFIRFVAINPDMKAALIEFSGHYKLRYYLFGGPNAAT